MAGEIQIAADTTALTVYAHLWSAVGTIWNGSAFESYATANIATYNIAMTEKGTSSRFYVGNFPAVAAGTYQITVQKQGGGSPVEADIFLGAGSYEWDGSAISSFWTAILEAGFSAGRLLRGIAGAVLGKSSGGGTTFRNASDTADAVSGTVNPVTRDRLTSTIGS